MYVYITIVCSLVPGHIFRSCGSRGKIIPKILWRRRWWGKEERRKNKTRSELVTIPVRRNVYGRGRVSFFSCVGAQSVSGYPRATAKRHRGIGLKKKTKKKNDCIIFFLSFSFYFIRDLPLLAPRATQQVRVYECKIIILRSRVLCSPGPIRHTTSQWGVSVGNRNGNAIIVTALCV